MTPRLWVFAGPNGAGKSTIVDRYVAGRMPVVNPDNIARRLAADLPDAARLIQAGRAALRERTTLLAARRSFGIETTLTGRSELDLMRDAVAASYRVNLVYVGLRGVALSLGRVGERVRRGGHDVPRADLLRRFDRSLSHLGEAMALANHRVILIDNSTERRQLVLSQKAGRVGYRSINLPDWAAMVLR